MVRAEVLKPFKWRATDGRILIYKPGQRIRAPKERLRELEARGYIKIVEPEADRLPFPDPVEMIGRVIKEVEGFYASGALRWARNQRPELYRRMETLEREIDQLARARALGLLKVKLEHWRETIRQIVTEFLAAEDRACCA